MEKNDLEFLAGHFEDEKTELLRSQEIDDHENFIEYKRNFNMYEETTVSYKNIGLMSIDFKHPVSTQLTRKYNVFKEMLCQFAEYLEENIDHLESTYVVVKFVRNNQMGFENGSVVMENDEVERRRLYNKKKVKEDKVRKRNTARDLRSKKRLEQHYDKLSIRDDDRVNAKHLSDDFHPTGCIDTIYRQAVKLHQASDKIKELEEKIFENEIKLDQADQVIRHHNNLMPRIITTFKTMNYKFNEFTDGVWFAACGSELNFDDMFASIEAFQKIRSTNIKLNKMFGEYVESNIDDRYFRKYDEEYDDETYDFDDDV